MRGLTIVLFLIVSLLAYGQPQPTYFLFTSKGKPIATKYQSPFNFSNGLRAIKINDKYGYVNVKDEIVIPATFGAAADFKDGFALIAEPGKPAFLIDKKGKALNPEGTAAQGNFKNGRALIKSRDGKFGYINASGKVVIPFVYDQAFGFSNGLAVFKLNDKSGVIDTTGEVVVPAIYKYINYYSEGLMLAVNDSSRAGYINKDGKVIIPFKFKGAGPFIEGRAAVVIDGKTGFINSQGTLVIPAEYDEVTVFKRGYAILRKGRYYGMIDKNNNVVMPFVHNRISRFNSGLAAFYSDSLFGYVNYAGKTVIPAKYKHAGTFYNGFAAVVLNDSTGLIDTTGKLIIDYKYSAITIGEDGYMLAKIIPKPVTVKAVTYEQPVSNTGTSASSDRATAIVNRKELIATYNISIKQYDNMLSDYNGLVTRYAACDDNAKRKIYYDYSSRSTSLLASMRSVLNDLRNKYYNSLPQEQLDELKTMLGSLPSRALIYSVYTPGNPRSFSFTEKDDYDYGDD